MYVCPKCEEEIPSKVKKTTEECPFCHEPWPPEEVAEPEPAVEEHKHPEGWGDEFKPSKPADPAAVHHKEPAKSKTWIFAVVGVVAVLMVVGAYFLLAGGKKGEGGDKAGAGGEGGVTDAEITAIDNWYRDVGKQLKSFLGEVCSVHHDRGYKYNSHFNKRVQTKTVNGKKVQVFDFDLKIQPAKGGKAKGALNIFECPVKLAEIHRDHPIVMEATIWERREVFGAVYKFADIAIKGKMVGHLDKKYRTIKRNVVLQNRDGFAFSKMKTMPQEPKYEGYRTLSTPMRFRMAPGIKSFTMSNLTWNKIKPGKYLQGIWRMELRTNDFHKQLKDWDDGCFGFRKRIAKLESKPKRNHTTHLGLTRVERQVTKSICDALKTLSDATGGDKVNAAALSKAQTTLNAARTRWNTEIYKKLADLAKKKDSAIRAKPL
jgi:hypothetical protein